jgi:hypothetical protein
MKSFKSRIILFLLISLVGGMILGVAVAALGAGGLNWIGWGAASLLSFISIFFLLLAWNWGGRLKIVGIMMIVAFAIRLIVGITLSLGLPQWGFDNPREKAGYIGTDAYQRDNDAWDLAKSDKNILVAFNDEYPTDQYGGLLAISAFIYRFLSPDIHRPFLILILTAFAAAMGIPFLWKAIEPRWGKIPALIACWLLALYPDVILSGASQMREAFLISLICIGFWAVNQWNSSKKRSAIVFVASMLGLLFFSWRTALAALAALGVWFVIDHLYPKWNRKLQVAAWIILGFGVIGAIIISFAWLKLTANWDSYLTFSGSGTVQAIVRNFGDWSRIPFITVYGLTQPVLPAALLDSTKPVWMAINIVRGLGWYALAPFLVYSLFAVWKIQPKENKHVILWVTLFLAVWILLASLRAGGDPWDNPRYRSIFLPWLGLLAGVGIDHARTSKDPWLLRWLVVEGIFLVIFTDWYIVRYTDFGIHINFYFMVVLIIILGAGVLVGGGLWDRRKNQKIVKH